MRLINTDEIEYFTMEMVGENSFKGNHNVISQFYIDKMPTVEAIPIEWIKKHLITHAQVLNGDYWADDAESINWYINNLIEDWRKENE